jgi:NAD(P)-dependent dehydrogenase (short-subunit alcohol dehydrogenase family)
VTAETNSILISGVNRGIGAALLRRYAQAGWRVHGVAREQSAVDLGDLNPSARDNVLLYECDLRQWDEIERLAASLTEPLDVLINNAATFGEHAFYARDFAPAAMLDAFAVNVVGPALLARELRAALLQGRRKLIVMMSTGNASLSGNTGGQMFAYRATKSALNQVVRTIAAEWGAEGITTVALNPGWVRTDMGGENAPLTPEEAAEQIFRFVAAAGPELNGMFCNTDKSPLPW